MTIFYFKNFEVSLLLKNLLGINFGREATVLKRFFLILKPTLSASEELIFRIKSVLFDTI
jgi:hypothetical protein